MCVSAVRYTLCKELHYTANYNFNTHRLIFVIFGRDDDLMFQLS